MAVASYLAFMQTPNSDYFQCNSFGESATFLTTQNVVNIFERCSIILFFTAAFLLHLRLHWESPILHATAGNHTGLTSVHIVCSLK